MSLNSDRVIAQEFDYIAKYEPTFVINRNILTGKVGKTRTGEDIRIKLIIPEFYPIVKPDIEVLNDISHPNINNKKQLALQILDEWDPNYRIKNILSAVRRLFVKSSNSISASPAKRIQKVESSIQKEIIELQNEITRHNTLINNYRNQQIASSNTQQPVSAIKITQKSDFESTIGAINDLLELLSMKFEEAEIEQTDFFRLYRRYAKEYYIKVREYELLGGN